MKPTRIDCTHQSEGGRRLYAVVWSPTPICDACLAAVAAANRVPTAANDNKQRVHVQGTGQVKKRPSLDNYDRAL